MKISQTNRKILRLHVSRSSLLHCMQRPQKKRSSSIPILFTTLPPPRARLPLPCRVLQRGESSQGTCLSPEEPPDSASLSLEYGVSFCPRCTSFRKERKKAWLTLYTTVINKHLLGAEITQWYTSSMKVISKSTGCL